MASVNSDSPTTRDKTGPNQNDHSIMSPTLNGDPDLATYPCTSASAQLLKLVTSASQIGNEHIPQSARNVGGHSPTIINRNTPLMTGENEALKIGYLDNQEVMGLNKENSPVYRTPTEFDRDPAKGRSLMKNFESEPLASLSRTSSLLREVHQFAEQEEEEESEEGGGTLEDEVEAARLHERASREQVLRSGMNGGGTAPLGRRQEHEREEPVTYHVLGNSTLVKFEPGVESEQQNSTNGLRVAVGAVAGGEAAAVDGSGFDGQTITLVEDENNVGTFKIAQIGVDNTLRVIDNDRIVVFQDETAVTAVCKREVLQPESDKVHEEESPSACISRSFHALNNDNINIPDAYRSATTATDNVGLYEDGSQRRQRRRDAASGFDHSATERVATFSETGVLRGLHSAEAALHAGQPLQPRPVLGPSPSGFPGVGNCQVKSWHYPTDREAPPPPPNSLTHFVGDASSSFAGANGSSEPGSVSAPTSSSSSAASIHPQSYPEYGVSSSGVPSAATQHGSYTELGAAAFPGYAPGVAAWSATGQPENVLAYSMPEGAEQKTGVGYGHPHAPVYTAIPPPFLSSGVGSGYVGYAGDVGRSWRAAKSNEATELAHNGRESTLYHQHQQQQQHQHPPQQPPHPGAYPPVPIVRPYATYPGWENTGAHPPQRHVRYMAPVGARGRSSSRIHKTRQSGMPVQTATNTGHLANMVTPRSSAPVLVSPAMVGRPRKRSASSHVDHAAVAKAGGFQPESNIHKGEPQRKRARDQHHNQQQQQQQQQQQSAQQQAMPLSALSTVSSNVHTLKPGHIIAWYIDYLIHENEDRTQISRAFTLPVNLFHTDDFYFLDSLRKKIRFPSAKFLAWMQCHLPSLNAHAIDFREGRASCDAASSVTSWNQDWGWQNKSKRDIIHDVFFYFQHRKAASTEPHQFMGVGGRTKAQLVVQ